MAAASRMVLTATFLAMAMLSTGRPVAAQSLPAPGDVLLPPPRTDIPPPPPPSSVPPSSPPAATLAPPTPLANPSPFAPPPGPPAGPPPGPPDASNPIYQPADPGPNGWGPYEAPSAPPRFFALHEVDIMKPHLKGGLTNNVLFPNGAQVQVQPPTTQPQWTGAPALEFGWTLPNSLGYFVLDYRGFATQGHQNALGLDQTEYALRTRLVLNQGALDYGFVPYAFMPHWELSGRFGIGLADVFFDNRAQNAFLTQYASNNFLGAGPHVRGDVRRHIGLLPGLDLFGRADFTVLVGQIHQNYVQANVNPDGGTTQASDFLRKTQTVPVFMVQAGVSYAPPRFKSWRFTAGYQFEEWWYLGQIDGLAPRGQFYSNGIFLRGEKTF